MSRKPTDREILRSLQLLHGHETFDSLSAAMMQVAEQLFDADIVSYSQYDATLGKELTLLNDEAADRDAQQLSPTLEQVLPTHPLLPITHEHPDMPPMRISDVMCDAKLRETAFYREYMRHFGTKYQLAISSRNTSAFHAGVTLNNSVSDFTSCDRELANLIRPHMSEAFRLVLLQERLRGVLTKQKALLDQTGIGQMDVAFDGRILNETPAARQALLKHFAVRQIKSSNIPSAIHEWLLSRLALNLDAKPIDQQPAFRLANAEGELSVTILSVQYELQQVSLLVSYSERFDPIKRLHRDGLTRREAEVLYRLTRGETDKQIANALGIRPATARTHVERIRGKLHVETRTAAATIAQEWLRARD